MAEQRTISRLMFEGGQQALAGVRSFVTGGQQELNKLAQTTKTSQGALSDLTRTSNTLGARIESDLTNSLEGLRSELARSTRAAEEFGRESRQSFGHAARAAHNFRGAFLGLGVIIGGLGIGLAAREMFQLGASLRGTERALATLTGSAANAKAELAFVREESRLLGLNFNTTAGQFVSFVAATQGTELREHARGLFSDIVRSMTALRRSGEQIQTVLAQTGQTLNTGRIQADEMRSIADAGIPIWRKLSEAIGRNVQETRELAEDGKLPAEAMVLAWRRLASELETGVVEAAGSSEVGFSRLRDQVSSTLSVMGGAILASPELARGLGDIGVAMLRFTEGGDASKITQTTDSVVIFVRKAITAIQSINFTDLLERLGNVQRVLITLIDIPRSLGELARKAGSAVADEVKDIAGVFQTAEASAEIPLTRQLEDLSKNLGLADEALFTYLHTLAQGKGPTAELSGKLADLQLKLLNQKKATDDAGESIGHFAATIVGTTPAVVKAAGDAGKTGGDKAGEAFKKATEARIAALQKRIAEMLAGGATDGAKKAAQAFALQLEKNLAAARGKDTGTLQGAQNAELQQAEETYRDLLTKAKEYGVSSAKVEELNQLNRANIIKKYGEKRAEFEEDIKDKLLSIQAEIADTPRASENEELRQAERDYQELLTKAKEYGVSSAKIEELNQAKRTKIVKEHAEKRAKAEADFRQDFLDEQKKAEQQLKDIDNAAKERSKVRFDRQIQEREDAIKHEEDAFQARQDLIQNATDNVTQILERVVEDDWIGALNGFFNFAADGLNDLGKQMEALGAATGNIQQEQFGKGLQTAGAVVGGVGAGVGTGFAVAELGKKAGFGGTTAGAVGGGVGGGIAGAAVGGAIAGSIVPGLGTAIGAIAGVIVGAVLGGVFGGSGKPATFARGIQTTPTAPFAGSVTDQASRRTPFGVVSIPAEDAKGIAGFRDLETIAQLDRSIAQFLSEQQKARVQGALAGTITGEIKGEDFGSAAGAVMAERIAVVLEAAIGGEEGARVARRFAETNPRGSPEETAIITSEILAINQLLERSLSPEKFSQFELAAKAVKDQFAEAIPLALDYGFSLETLKNAQAAAMGQWRDQFNTGIQAEILAIENPMRASMQLLAQEHQARLADAQAVGGSIEAVHKLTRLRQKQIIDEQTQREQERADFFRGVQIQILEVTNATAAAELRLIAARDQMLAQARQMGATQPQLAQINRLYDVQRADMLKQRRIEAQQEAAAQRAEQQAQAAARRAQQQAAAQQRRAAEQQRRAQAQQRRAQEIQAAQQQRAEAIRRQQELRGLMVGVQGNILDITNPVKAAFYDLAQQQNQMITSARQLGASEGQLAQIRRLVGLQTRQLTQQTQAEVKAFNTDIESRILQFKDPLQAELKAAEAAYQERLKQARAYGQSTVRIEALYQLERQKILSEGADQNTAIIQDFIRDLTSGPGSPLAPDVVLANATKAFRQATAAGDAGGFVEASRSYLDALQTMYASSPEFFRGFQEVLDQAKRFGVDISGIQGPGAAAGSARAAQEQQKIQQRQAQEQIQAGTRVVSILVDVHIELRKLNGKIDALTSAVNGGSNNVVTAINRRGKSSLGSKAA